ncbi:MAG TPA: bile acid:sodium symporter [Terriglobales bacterium]|nr:bile acid:sodium symporter [Terriglobales bacterium]
MAVWSGVLNVVIPLFAITSMFVVGARFTLSEILEPFRHWQGSLLLLLANFVLVPLLGYGLAGWLLSAHASLAIGLVLVASAAGAPFLLQLTKAAQGNLMLSSGLLLVLVLVTIATMPFLVPLLIPSAAVAAPSIAIPLVLTMLLPLCVGAAIRQISIARAQQLWPLGARLAAIVFAVLIVLTFVLYAGDVAGLAGTGALAAAALLVAGAFGIGHVLGHIGGESRTEVGLATAQRNIGAATVVAVESFHDPDVLVMVVAASLVTLAVLIPLSRTVARRSRLRFSPYPTSTNPESR